MRVLLKTFLLLAGISWLYSCQRPMANSLPEDGRAVIEQTRDKVLQRILDKTLPENLNKLSSDQILSLLSKEEKVIFANLHWRFMVDKPALVSVMRHKKQEVVPFWLEEKEFIKTAYTVSNENYDYEVWQKEFPAGEISLGINGFDLHRPVYFVTIGPVDGGEKPEIIQYVPQQWPVIRMEKGAYTYNDWDELVIEEFPKELEGHQLFTTIRGRSREAAIQGSFRETLSPSSSNADQIVLTWAGDPTSTQAIQWRTNPKISSMSIRYWMASENKEDYNEILAEYELLNDNYIFNDPSVKHWQVNLTGLTPDTKYCYSIYNRENHSESETYTFTTAPESNRSFRFIYLGDTHNDSIVKSVLNQAIKEAPDASFLIHSGDHVNTGLFRNLWDLYFDLGKDVFPSLTFVPTLGNHDSQDGLPPTLYTKLFMLPENGVCNLPNERNYSFTFGNTRFFMVDATGDINHIACWLEKELSQAKETWKIVVTHFPPFVTDDSYPEVRKTWCSLFDTYHVDLVLSGHVHQYFRSYPINNQQVVKDPSKGTIYISSVTVEPREPEPATPKYNQVYTNAGGLFQIISIDNDKLSFISKKIDGTVIDQFQIIK